MLIDCVSLQVRADCRVREHDSHSQVGRGEANIFFLCTLPAIAYTLLLEAQTLAERSRRQLQRGTNTAERH